MSDKRQNLALACCEFGMGGQVRIGGAGAMAIDHEAYSDGQVKTVLANCINRCEQLLTIIGFGDIGMYTGIKHAADGVQVDIGGQYQNFQGGKFAAQLTNESQPVDARHAQIQK
ncbi:hypothetical protein D3C77_623240 [compost metagenome]